MENLILQGGALAVLCLVFYLLARFLMIRFAKVCDTCDSHTEIFNETIQNHLLHEQEAMKELTEAIKHLADIWENGR